MNTGQVFDDGDHVEPRTELETALCSMWTQVLGIESIGVTDNFFDLGASSINGARLLSEMETQFGRRLPLGALFQAPTIEGFAKMVEESAPAPTRRWTSLVPVQPLGSKPPIFCVHGGAGTVYVYHALARRLGTDQPFTRSSRKGYTATSRHITKSKRWRRTTSARCGRCSRPDPMRLAATASAASSPTKWRSSSRRWASASTCSRCSTRRIICTTRHRAGISA